MFVSPPAGVLRLDDDVFITESRWGDAVLRHYAFADNWLKINVTTDLAGVLMETGDEPCRFAFNCDIATPMERDGDSVYAADLFVDVLMKADAQSYEVTDRDELEEMVERGLVSRREAAAAVDGLRELIARIESGRLLPWLAELHPFGECDPPTAIPMQREPVPTRLQRGARTTW